jgi:hypothetical protein
MCTPLSLLLNDHERKHEPVKLCNSTDCVHHFQSPLNVLIIVKGSVAYNCKIHRAPLNIHDRYVVSDLKG